MNPEMDEICYHHYSLNLEKNEIRSKLHDIRLVLVAGCWRRVLRQAKYLADRLVSVNKGKFELETLTKEITRFKLFKVGPVLISDHGMGGASMSIAIHELMVMCRQANVFDQVTVIRFGTCGGLGVEAGNLCITDRAVDPLLNEFIEMKIIGKSIRRPCILDKKTNQLIQKLLSENPNHNELGYYEVIIGTTLATNDFYEEQGRTNGAICDHTMEDKKKFLTMAKDFGVVNIEMESNYLAAMCHKLGVRYGIICVALTNRLRTDAFSLTSYDIEQFENRLFWSNFLLARHILSQ